MRGLIVVGMIDTCTHTTIKYQRITFDPVCGHNSHALFSYNSKCLKLPWEPMSMIIQGMSKTFYLK